MNTIYNLVLVLFCVQSNCSDKLPLSDLDSLMSSNAMQGIHQQFDKHMSLVQDLEKERQKAHQLRDVRLAGIEVYCLKIMLKSVLLSRNEQDISHKFSL